METNPGGDATPLIVDLDGTLFHGDIFWEDLLSDIGGNPMKSAPVFSHLLRGKSQAKHFISERVAFDATDLPYNAAVIDLIDAARRQGRKVYLATGSHVSRAEAIAAHLGCFDGVFATTIERNLTDVRKAAFLAETFGERGFDYVGNSFADIPVWQRARRAYVVAPKGRLTRRLDRQGIAHERLPERELSRIGVWLRAMRVHQYSKNVLVFVPMLAAHRFDLDTVVACLTAFVAFCLIASSVYLINDLIDIRADRGHPTKKKRPIPFGLIQAPNAIVASVLLIVLGGAVAASASLAFLAVVAAYFVMTLAYSTFIKRKMLVDSITLSLLYTARIAGGAVAAQVVLSSWLAIFSLFFFTALALIKRYTELRVRLLQDLADPSNRNYRKEDLTVIGALAAASAVNSVTVFALYVASPVVAANYTRPWALGAICPLLLYLLGRMLMMAHRGEMDDDPIVFALRDRNWRLAGIALFVIFLAAI